MSKRKHDHEGHESDERWLITYADMITLLMVFFIVLFSMANTDLKKFSQVADSMREAFHILGSTPGAAIIGKTGGGDPDMSLPSFIQTLSPQQRGFMSVTSELTAFASQTGLEGNISVNMNMEGVIISLSNALIFESGNAELKPESVETLHKIAEILKTLNNPIRIEGHTDNLPTNDPNYPTNWELSVARAVTIVRYLIEKEGIAPDRLLAAGRAEFAPVASNDTRANRALNRRADIIIIYPRESRSFSIYPHTPAGQQTNQENTQSSDPVAMEQTGQTEAEEPLNR